MFSTAAREVVVAKLVILGIWLLTTFVLELREAAVAKLVILNTLSSILYLYLSIYLSTIYIFLNNIIFLLHHLIYLNQQEQVLKS